MIRHERHVSRCSESLSPESLEGRSDIVRAAWNATQPTYDESSWSVCDIFDAAVVVRKDLMFRRVPYAVDGAVITFGEPIEVEVKFEEVGEAAPLGRPLQPSGSVWEVRVLKFGRSLNGWLWSREAGEKLLAHLKSAPVGCYVFQNGVTAHASEEAILSAHGPLVRNVVADIQEPRLEPDGVYAELHIHEDAGWLKTKLLGLQSRGVVDKVLGLSIDTLAGYVPVQLREGATKAIKEIGRLISIDIVTAPSADGRFLRATAGPLLMPHHTPQEDLMTREQIITLIQANRPQLLAGRAIESVTDETLQLLLGDAIRLAAPLAPIPASGPAPAPTVMPTTPLPLPHPPQWAADMERRYAVSVTQARVIEALSGATTLPVLSRERIRKHFADKIADMAEIGARIQEERQFLADLSESGEIRGFGATRSEVLAAPRDKVQAALDRLIFRDVATKDLEVGLSMRNSPFSPETIRRLTESWKGRTEAMKDRGLEFRGLRDAYVTITGDSEITGQVIRGRASEAILSTTWADILGNTLYRRLLLDYALPVYNERTIAEFGTAPDFRTREAIHLNYFGDISTVDPEAADYVEITAPGDDKVSYAVTQRGNLLTISRKTIINDDIRAVEKLVGRLGRAARRTLAKFIWNFWMANSVFDVDALAWFHATHANTGTVALTADAAGAAEVFAKIQQLAAMTEPGSAAVLGPVPRGSLWLDVPVALMSVAYRLNTLPGFTSINDNPVFGYFGGLDNDRINVCPLFTDVTDWGVHVVPGADGRESIQVDFLQGREEPEFFLADQPTVGQAFVGDKIVWKIRHEYGGDILDFRGAARNVVAG